MNYIPVPIIKAWLVFQHKPGFYNENTFHAPIGSLSSSAEDTEVQPSDQQEVTGVIAEIRSAVIEGNTWYYLRLEQGDVYYAVSSADQRSAALLSVGDTVKVQYMAGEETILDTYAVSLVPKT